MFKSGIPVTWAKTTIRHAAKVEYGKGLPERLRREGNTQVVASGGVVGSHDQFLFEKPIIVTGRKGNIGAVYFITGRSWVIDTAFALIPSEMIETKFLFWLLKGFNFKNIEASSAIPSISREALYDVNVPVCPISEQKRIVAKIESTQEKIKTIEQTVTKAEQLIGKYREALLQKAFRGKLVPQDPNDEPASKLLERIHADRAKQPDGKRKKKDDLPAIKPEEIPFVIPKSWEWVRLGEVIEIRSGGTPKELPDQSDGEDVKFVKVADMNSSVDGKTIDSVTLMLNHKTADQLGIVPLPTGTIIFPKRGGAILTNKKRVLDSPAAVDTNIMGIIPPSELGEFLWFWFQSIDLATLHTGSTIPQINNGDIFPILVPVPPKEETKRIIAKFSKCTGEFKNTIRQTLHLTSKCQQAILNLAFSGHLVPQVLSEGTGHDLLEKIKDLNQTGLIGPDVGMPNKANHKKNNRTKK